MKHLFYFKENISENKEKVFEDDNWLIIKPSSYEALLIHCDEQNWNISEYRYSDEIYININKKDDTKVLLDFNYGNFYEKDENVVYLKDFLDNNNSLLKFYGELIHYSSIIKENNEYWIVVKDYGDFDKYFILDSHTRNDLIKQVLSGDARDIFSYHPADFDLNDYGFEVAAENLDLLKILLILEKHNNVYDYDIDDITDYDDIVEIVKEYGLTTLKDTLKSCICTSIENADADAAYEDITNKIYDFFNLELGSAKWEKFKDSKYQCLWIKFKRDIDAYNAKFIMRNDDNSYDDDKIEYSPPYNGYYVDIKIKNEVFNNEIPERIVDEYNEVDEYLDRWKKIKEKNQDSDMESEIEIMLNLNKYNL